MDQLQTILGMNHRNRHLVDLLNPKRLIVVANDKLATKQRLRDQGIPTPATYDVVQYHHQVDPAYERLLPVDSGFVVKPARAAGGKGVLICSRALPDRILDHRGTVIPRNDFIFLLLQILHGEFSFGREQDAVLIEQRLDPCHSWVVDEAPGAPDLRIIVWRGRPVMAMARVPTLASDGRANLHCGGVGVGIDLATGLTTYGVWKNRSVTAHPDTGQNLGGRPVEGMADCLRLAEQCYRAVPLGYMGVDILFDARCGPMVIEVNARPGLSVQVANRKGLLSSFLEQEQELSSRGAAEAAAAPRLPEPPDQLVPETQL